MLLSLLSGHLAKGTGFRGEDEILKSFVQKTAAICFIPPTYIRVAWQGLQHEAPDIDRIDDFVEYFDHTWINGQYRISQWNYYDYHGPELISWEVDLVGS